MACARCLRPVAVPLRVEMDERFSRRPDDAEDEDEDEGETRAIVDSCIDLTDCARELLILELPMRVLCSEDCKGLCPVCGADRNEVSCACLRDAGSVRARGHGAAPKKAASPERSQTPFRH